MTYHVLDNIDCDATHIAYRIDGDPPAGYLNLYDGWSVYADTAGAVAAAAALGRHGFTVYDQALPQSWYDEHRDEIDRRGGWAVWAYSAASWTGEPVFADTLIALARVQLAGSLAAALRDRPPST
jgi:hypothetical protein